MTVDPYVVQQATYRANRLVATSRFNADEREDLRQEMIVDCLRRSSKFDASRGHWPGFVRGVTKNHAAVLFARRSRIAQREVLAEDLWQRAIGIADEREDRGDVSGEYGSESALHLSIDVRRVLEELPPHLKKLAGLLAELPVSEACVQTGKSRSRVYQMTRQIRDAFVRAGIQPGHF
jgi:DNA-directed RNA polymerase specialized sigma24 family protein